MKVLPHNKLIMLFEDEKIKTWPFYPSKETLKKWNDMQVWLSKHDVLYFVHDLRTEIPNMIEMNPTDAIAFKLTFGV